MSNTQSKLPHSIFGRMFRFPSPKRTPVITSTSNVNLRYKDTGTACDNYGATGAVTYTLPEACDPGVNFLFHVMTAQQLRIDPGDDTHQIMVNGTLQTAGLYIVADALNEWCWLHMKTTTVWYAMTSGTWTVEGA